MALRVTWDPWKALLNKRKHGVSFREAESALRDGYGMTTADELHSFMEARFAHVGMSSRNQLLLVIYADHGDTLRIITARRASSAERRTYEEGQGG